MRKKLKNEILISTVLSNLDNAKCLALNAFVDTKIPSLIICQTFEDPDVTYNNICEEEYRVIFTRSIGLSKSRQEALESSIAEYIWFLDDDVTVLPEGCISAFDYLTNNDVDILTTKYSSNSIVRKKYSMEKFEHTRLSIMKVSSIEIFCNRDFLMTKCIKFDSNFGLGSTFVSGEENIFLSDCLLQGAKIQFLPLITSDHPPITSGGNYDNAATLISKGAVIRRVYGFKGLPLIFLYFIKRVYLSQIKASKIFRCIGFALNGFFSKKNKIKTFK